MLWFKRDKKEPEKEPADIHPQHKRLSQIAKPKTDPAAPTRQPIPAEKKPIPASKPTTAPKPPAEKKPAPAPTSAPPEISGLDQEGVEALRQAEFEEMKIPFKEILAVESRGGLRRINPREFKKESLDLQSKFAQYGFGFAAPSFYEIFVCKLLRLDHERMREAARNSGRPMPPAFDELQIIVWREAERRVRQTEKIPADKSLPIEESKKLTEKIKQLYEAMWQGAEDKMIRRQAERRLRHEKKLHGGDALPEAELQAMITKIKTERREAQAKKN
jgi:hypothetical protein